MRCQAAAHHVARGAGISLAAAHPGHRQQQPRSSRVIAGHGGDMGVQSVGLLSQRVFGAVLSGQQLSQGGRQFPGGARHKRRASAASGGPT
ncbi:hypothetical protein RKD37_002743 [Streptomyces ambofaciens]